MKKRTFEFEQALFYYSNMPVSNIRDRRTNWLDARCNVAIESSWHDNGLPGATEFPTPPNYLRDSFNDYLAEEIVDTTVRLALEYANATWPDRDLTVFFYDSRPAEPGDPILDPVTRKIVRHENGTFFAAPKDSSLDSLPTFSEACDLANEMTPEDRKTVAQLWMNDRQM